MHARRLRPLLWPALFTLAVGAFLVGLGVWQLQRLAWKEALLARIQSRIHAAPVPAPPARDWPTLAPETYDVRHVSVEGTFLYEDEALVFDGTPSGALAGSGPGYLVLTPLRLASGDTIIVNRGFVPLDHADPATRQAANVAGPVTVTGLMRPPQSRNLFTPADDPASGRYFTSDPALIAAHFGLAGAAPFSIDADDTKIPPGGWPRGGTTVVDIPNNHLGYALTWFGLAIGLLGVFVAFIWRRLGGDGDASYATPPAARSVPRS